VKGPAYRESSVGTNMVSGLKLPYACAKSSRTDVKQLIQSYSSTRTTVLTKHKWNGEADQSLRHNRATLMVPVASALLAGKDPHQIYFKFCIFLMMASPC